MPESESTADPPRARGDRLLWWVVGVSAVVAALTVVGTRLLVPPELPPPGAGQVFRRMPRPPVGSGELLRTLGIGSLTWYACILSAPLFFWLGRRLPIDRRRWPSSLAVHLLVVLLLVLATAAVQHRLSYAGAPVAPPLGDFLEIALLTGSLPFLAVAAAAHALEARTRAHERELDAARARSQLAEVRLEALTAQLQPHFLFNTLQGISTLITRDPAAADRMLGSLSDLLREVLRRSDAREVEVAEELRVLAPYLDIARWRFGARLSIAVHVDAGAERALVPFFVLQPLVENAIRHGVESRAGAGAITIRVERREGGARLLLSVSDDGPGVDDTPAERRGIGLANTRARLRELYGAEGTLDLARGAGDGAGGGSRATVAIPFRVGA